MPNDERSYEERYAAALDAMTGLSYDDNSPAMCLDDALKAFGARELVGELRAERTRTETLRNALRGLYEVSLPHGATCSTNRCVYCGARRALAASVEEPPAR